jgi:hypothetical protein
MQSRAHRNVQFFDESVEVLRNYFDHLLSSATPKAKRTRAPNADKPGARKED